MKTFERTFRFRRGVALVMVLWVVLVSGLMLLGVMKAARMQNALSHGELAAVQAHWLARAGVEQAMAVLEDDDPAVDGQLEKWYRDESLFDNVSLGSGTFSVRGAADDHRPGLDDEASRLNLNVADKQQLTELKSLSDGQINALLEWRTAPAATPGAGGNESKGGYYQQLRFPYEMRQKDLQTHREVLLIQGFEDRKFFGDSKTDLAATGPAAQTTVYSYQTNLDPKSRPRMNINSASSQQLQERFNFTPSLADAVVQGRRPRYQSLSALLDVRPQAGGNSRPGGNSPPRSSTSNEPPVAQITLEWLAGHAEEICLDSSDRLPGKVNINTASHEVLMTLPGMNGEIADRIIFQRGASGGAFTTLKDVLDRHAVEPDAFRRFFDRLTVRSDVFTVESTGISGSGMQRRILAVIDRGQMPMRICYWYQTP